MNLSLLPKLWEQLFPSEEFYWLNATTKKMAQEEGIIYQII